MLETDGHVADIGDPKQRYEMGYIILREHVSRMFREQLDTHQEIRRALSG